METYSQVSFSPTVACVIDVKLYNRLLFNLMHRYITDKS